MPQYLERQSNQPQKRDGKSDTTEAYTIWNKNCIHTLRLMSVKKRLTNDKASKMIFTYNI